ncbi:MAG: DUF11 domain-containing protein [Candidatus Sulfomarinibacteraceae bacterium]
MRTFSTNTMVDHQNSTSQAAIRDRLPLGIIWLAGLVAALIMTAGIASADPPLASTFLGGSGGESSYRSVRDADGNIYVANTTTSTDFPTTPGVHGPTFFGGSHDIFVAKLTPDLTTLLAATYVGGSDAESYAGLAITSDGSILVAGGTLSTDIPVTPGAYQSVKSSETDIFVVKLSSDLTTVLAATYLGATGTEPWGPLTIDVDSSDNAVLGCRSTSSDFPTTEGAYDRTYNDYAPGHGDAVVARLDGALTTLLASTFIGGALWDQPRHLDVQPDGTVLVAGDTNNSTGFGAFYPTTPGAYSTCSNNNTRSDAFVSRLSADFSTLVASTCIGGFSGNEYPFGFASRPDGSLVVFGRTESTTFPTTPGAYATTYGGTGDAFIAIFDYGLSSLQASTYLGNYLGEWAYGAMIDPLGRIHVAGMTESSNFPTTPDAFDATLDGTRDAFYVRFDATLQTLEYATFLGGSDTDAAYGVFLVDGQLYLHGGTGSTDFPTTTGAYDETYNGAGDGFVFSLTTIEDLDYGDAPDPTYPTVLASNGARHAIDGTTYLGAAVDAENDGQPTADADGDDLDGTDDEDGVVFTSGLGIGLTAFLEVEASTIGLLNAWVDTNGDGDWDDAGEQVFTDEPLVSGTNPLSFTVPQAAVPGTGFARFRFDSSGGLSYDGPAFDGEVEDHSIVIQEIDFGDAPDPNYPTLLASGGAAHLIGSGLYLGASVDGEIDGQPTAGADGDDADGGDDEDGVVFTSPLGGGLVASLEIAASGAGLLNAWIDFNADGDWDDPGEQVFTDEALVAGVNPLSFPVAAGAVVGNTVGRFRFDTLGGLSASGLASDGEVEDHLIQIDPSRDLEVTVGDSPDPVPEGGRLVYHIAVWTNGELDSGSVELTHDLPAETTFVSAGHGGCSETGGVVTCDLGTVTPGSPIQFEIEADVAFGTTGAISSTTAVSSPDGDLFPANNSTTETTTVVDEPTYIFSDGFERGDTTRWSGTSP